MTTTTHPLPTTTRSGAPIVDRPGQSRHLQAIALRHAGIGWAEIASRTGYRSAATCETAIMRYVAWRNGNPGATTTNRRTLAHRAVWGLTRSFGVEIEFAGITRRRAAVAIGSVTGYTPTVRGYHAAQTDHMSGGNGYQSWSVERDGSVTTSRGNGGECVSPVLSGAAGFAELKAVMAALRAAGARVDARCGMHVHVDARDLTGEQIARVIACYVDRQEAFDQFVSPSRRSTYGNHYCRPMGEHEKQRITDGFKATRTSAQNDRYRTVNTTAFGRLGTIEFRQHQGTLNGTKAASWVETLLAMFNAVLATEDETLPTTATELVAALRPFALTPNAARHMAGRAA